MTEPVRLEEPETRQEEDGQPPTRSLARLRLRPAAAMLLVTALFFALALSQSLTHTWNSDTASVALQGWDLVHGHLLLHGWWASDVNFYTFDAPIYGLCALVLGLGGTALHVAGALIYTLVFLSACWLAKGRSHGSVYWFRVALVALLMTAVLFEDGLLGTVMLVPDHNGTIVFVFVAYVLYSRYAARRWTPWAMLVLLTLGQLGDVSIRYVLVPSLLLVWAADALRTRRSWRLRAPENLLALAALISVALSFLLRAVMKHFGAYYLTPAHAAIAPRSTWGWRFTGTWQSLLSLFGVSVFRFPGGSAFRDAITFAGGFALVCGVLSVLAVLIRWTKVDVADRLLAVTCIAYVGAYEFSTVGSPGAGGGYEFVGVIAMFAVLGARMISPLRPLRAPVPRAVVTVVAALGALTSLVSGTSLFQPVVRDPLQPLAGWLQQHDLTYGLAGYWNSAPVTVYSGGRVKVRQVYLAPKGFVPQTWGADQQWYVPAQNDANFVIAQQNPRAAMTPAQVEGAFGKPAEIYQVDGYTILVYDYNLLTKGHAPVVPPGS
jgi:hypothetical protein